LQYPDLARYREEGNWKKANNFKEISETARGIVTLIGKVTKPRKRGVKFVPFAEIR